jgi:hypothetical protein
VFEFIKQLRPYFFSLREIENNVSLDIKLPLTWKFEHIVTPYRTIKTKVQDKNEKFTLLSIVSNATKEGYEVIAACSLEIIKINREEEEKRRLFEQKVSELKTLFQHESLDKLKDITFIETYGKQEIRPDDRLVGEGDGEGQSGDTESQEDDDLRDQEIRQGEDVPTKRKK